MFNSLVDVGNVVSLRLQVPVGLYDMEQVAGDLRLRLGREGESYAGIGKESVGVAGTVNPGPNAVKLQKTSYNASAGSVHMEADAGPMGKRIHYVIEGKIENGLMFGTWNHEDKKGDFRLLRK